MRARRTRASFCAVVLLAAPLASCTKNKPGTNVTIADDAASGETARVAGDDGTQPERGDIEKIQVSGSITGIGDMLDAGAKLLNMWSPPEPGAPPIDLRSILAVTLIQEGFGPGFLESIDLDGVHAAELGFPHEGQPGVTERDIDLALVLAAIDPIRAIESMPAGMQPQPMGDGIWQLVEDQNQLLFRARGAKGQPGNLEVALNMAGLDRAASLPAQVVTGPNEPRIKIAASNVPSANIDLSDMIPLPSGMSRTLSSIINEAESVNLAADFGSDRDLVTRVGAQAPFGRLGLDPIGPATQAPSELAKALPGHAMFVWLMPWGDPKLLHDVLDKQIPVNEIPAPFDSYVDEVLAGSHAILAAIDGEVLAATYVEKRKFSLVLAAGVNDEAKARDALREIFGAAEKAFKDHIALAGSSADHKYKVSFKKDAIKVGKAKGDLFTVTIPKDKQEDMRDLGWFFGPKNPQLEVAMVVADGKLIVVIGAGQKDMMRELGKRLGRSGDDGLEAGGGLALARKLAGGCQYCVAVEPIELGEFAFTVVATDQSEPKQVQAAATKALTDLAKLGLAGEIAFALRLDDSEGMLGAGVPKSLLFAEPDKIKAVLELIESVDEAREAAWAAESSSKNDSKSSR